MVHSFWSLAVCKNGGGRPGNIYDISDINVYLDRQREGPKENSLFEAFLFSFDPCVRVLNVCKVKKLPLVVSTGQNVLSHLETSVYLGWCHSCHKCAPGLPPLFLHTASYQKLDGGKASEQGYQPDAKHFHPNEHLVTTLSKVSQSLTCNRESSFHCRWVVHSTRFQSRGRRKPPPQNIMIFIAWHQPRCDWLAYTAAAGTWGELSPP